MLDRPAPKPSLPLDAPIAAIGMGDVRRSNIKQIKSVIVLRKFRIYRLGTFDLLCMKARSVSAALALLSSATHVDL